MAEFCKQCADELQFDPDFVGLISEEEVAKGFGALVLFEGCGPILVNHLGECITSDCLEKHGVKSDGA
jgi:hypothetical protein